MTKQNKLRTFEVKINDNISVPMGNIMLAEAFFERFGLYGPIKKLKKKGADLGKLAETMVAYKLGDNFSILRCHEFSMQEPIRRVLGLPEMTVRTFYRAVETLGVHSERIVGRFRKRFMRMYGVKAANHIFDWTTLVYYGDRPGLAKRGHSKDGHPEECQVSVGIAQLAKPLGVPIGMTVMPGNTHDGTHMKQTYGQVRDDIIKGSTMVFDAGANQKDVTDMISGDGNHFVTRRDNTSVRKAYLSFSLKTWKCLDESKGEYCTKVPTYLGCVNYYFFSLELYKLEMEGVEKRARKKLAEAKSLQKDIDDGKKMKKRYEIDNVLIKATISLQTRLKDVTDEEAMEILRKAELSGHEGFFCLTSDRDMAPHEVRSLYREKDLVEKLFSSMKTDIGIRPIRMHTDDGIRGVLLIAFLAQALVSVTRILSKPASSTATKFITDSMQKLTLTVERGTDGRERRIFSNFNPMNVSILRSYGLIPEVENM
jgi:transposase